MNPQFITSSFFARSVGRRTGVDYAVLESYIMQHLEAVEEGAAMLSTKPMLLKRTTTKGFSAEAKIIYDEPSGVTFMEGYESAKIPGGPSARTVSESSPPSSAI